MKRFNAETIHNKCELIQTDKNTVFDEWCSFLEAQASKHKESLCAKTIEKYLGALTRF